MAFYFIFLSTNSLTWGGVIAYALPYVSCEVHRINN